VRFPTPLPFTPRPNPDLWFSCVRFDAAASMRTTVKPTSLFLLVFLSPILASGQSPTFVQHASCSNSRSSGNAQSSAPNYKCPLPEGTQAGNSIIVGTVSSFGATFAVSDDKGNPYSLVNSTTDANGVVVSIYVASNVAAGSRMVNLHRSNITPNVAMSVSEYYNVGAVDASACHPFSGSSTSITAGSMTPTVTGDLLWQWAINAGGGGGLPNSTSSFSAGSQSNITWQLNGTDLYDGDATQAGIYNATSTINPTFTSGTAQNFTSCAVALKAASVGTAPTATFRILHMLHQQHPKSAANPFAVQFPTSGNLIVNSYISGGSNIASISSSPSNTWSSTGPQVGNEAITALSQIYYAANASTSSSMTMAVSRNDNSRDGTFMLYDITGAASSPFDKDSGGETANQTGLVSSFTTCSGCLTPSSTNEIVIANAGWNFCTGIGVGAPNGSLLDSATDTGNGVDGPESVDQNNGWLHYYDPNTNPVTVTWAMACGGTAESEWAGRVAAFKSGGSVVQQPPPPPTQLKAVVN
jgi:hypothetical protein